MKKLLYGSLAMIIALVFVVSCGEKTAKEETAKDINVEKLNSACDCVDASLTLISEMLDLAKEWDRLYDINEDDPKLDEIENQVYSLEEVMDKIDRRCDGLDFDWEDLEKCSNFKEMFKKLAEFDDTW